jgi:hypothetical protein
MAVKTSILVFYLTLTKGEKVFRWANYVTLFAVNAAGLALTLVNVFQCHPVAAAFTYPLPPTARCIDILTLYLSSSPVNIITDLAILFIPNPILTQMRLPRKQKIILVITFSFGFFVAVVDVIRIAYIQDAATSRQIAVKDLHYQSAAGDDFSCMTSNLFTAFRTMTDDASRVRISLVHVVSCRSQCVCDVRVCPQSEAPCGSSHPEVDQGHGRAHSQDR